MKIKEPTVATYRITATDINRPLAHKWIKPFNIHQFSQVSTFSDTLRKCFNMVSDSEHINEALSWLQS